MTDWGDKVVFFPGEPSGGGLLARAARQALHVPPRELYYKAVRHLYRRFRPRSFPFPQWVHIEVTNACNLDCVMCPRRDMDRPVGFMEMALFEKLIDQMRPFRRYIEGVALMGLGEPLLHKRFVEMSAIAKRAGFAHVYTSTNATLLTEAKTEALLAEGGLDRIIFSVDGADKKTFEAIRVGGDYDVVAANVRRFLERKRESGRTRPRTTFQMLVMNETADQVDGFLRTWVPLLGPTDDILVKNVDTFGGQVLDFRTERKGRPPERIPCRQLWKDLSVSWDGRVTVCCKDVLYRLAVGSAADTPLVDLWKSEAWNRLREAHLAGRWTMPPCDRCDEWYL